MSRFLTIVLALATLCQVAAPAAYALSVQPLIIDLNQRTGRLSGSFTVTNRDAAPVPVEIRVEETRFTTNGPVNSGKPSEDLVVLPPQALVGPGRTQTFRLQYVGDPALTRSRHYHVTVAQVPVANTSSTSNVQILYNFQILVSIAAPGLSPVISVAEVKVGKNARGEAVPEVTFQNTAATYGYLSQGRLRLVMKDASGAEVLRQSYTPEEVFAKIGAGMMGPEQRRVVQFPVVLPTDRGALSGEFTYERRRR